MSAKKCKRCGDVIPRGLNFCNPCASHINQAHERVKEHAQGTVMLLKADKPAYTGQHTPREKDYAKRELVGFLAVFHPEISTDKAVKLAHSTYS